MIMNPPFTRATNHEGAHADVTNPAFAAFDAAPADQSAMGSRINELGQGNLLPRQRGYCVGLRCLGWIGNSNAEVSWRWCYPCPRQPACLGRAFGECWPRTTVNWRF